MTARLPTESKKFRGTFRPCRDAVNAPQPPKGIPPAPKSLTKEAKKLWPDICALLESTGVLTHADGMAVQSLAECYAELCALRQKIDKEGRFYESETRDGGKRVWPHPAVAMMQDADKRLKAWLASFGLTPADRGRVSTGPSGQDSDDLSRFTVRRVAIITEAGGNA